MTPLELQRELNRLKAQINCVNCKNCLEITGCTDGQVPSWDADLGIWVCTEPLAIVADFPRVDTCADLPDPTLHTDQYYHVIETSSNNMFPTWWPTWLGGDFCPAGLYWSNGVSWVYLGDVPNIQYKDEGGNLGVPGSVAEIDFIGTGVTATLVANKLNVTIPGGTSSGGQTENLSWRFDNSIVAADPGSGDFRLDNATPASITNIYFDDLTSDGFDVSNVFTVINGDWLVYFQDTGDSTKFMAFSFDAANLVDNTGWWTMPVTFVQVGAGGLPSNNRKCTFLLINKNTGSGPSTSNAIPMAIALG